MKTNIQPIEKQIKSDGLTLDVHSIFQTIQGEGPFAGTPCLFIRLAGCNLQCPFCDTEYTGPRSPANIELLVQQARMLSTPSLLVVITGGEPFRQNILPLITLLFEEGFSVQIETNGTLFLQKEKLLHTDRYILHATTIVCSPKTGKINKDLAPFIDAYKYVVESELINWDDGLPILALGHSAKPQVARPHPSSKGTIVYVQPVDVQDPILNKMHLEAAKKSCIKFGHTLCVQIHKIIEVE